MDETKKLLDELEADGLAAIQAMRQAGLRLTRRGRRRVQQAAKLRALGKVVAQEALTELKQTIYRRVGKR